MDQNQRGIDDARLLEVGRLYKSGLKLREVGERLSPQVRSARVVQLLQQGQERGHYGNLRAERHAGEHLTEVAVRAAAMAARKRENIAPMLRVTRDVLESRFGELIDQVRTERRNGRRLGAPRAADKLTTRERAVHDYVAVSRVLGRNPTTRDLRGTGLVRRIHLYFGTFANVLDFAGLRSDYVKPTWKKREALRRNASQ